jgi:hypothetical protein
LWEKEAKKIKILEGYKRNGRDKEMGKAFTA